MITRLCLCAAVILLCGCNTDESEDVSCGTAQPDAELAEGALLFEPQAIDFGLAPTGQPVSVIVEGRNVGTGALEVGPTVIESPSDDFTSTGPYLPNADGECGGFIAATAEVLEAPFTLERHSSYCINVIYTPHGAGADNGSLVAYEPTGAANPNGSFALAQATINGSEAVPRIAFKPERA
jgi:hypothetical protein